MITHRDHPVAVETMGLASFCVLNHVNVSAHSGCFSGATDIALKVPGHSRPLARMASHHTVTETTMPVLGKHGAASDTIVQIEPTKPAVRQILMYLFARLPFGPYSKGTDHQSIRING